MYYKLNILTGQKPVILLHKHRLSLLPMALTIYEVVQEISSQWKHQFFIPYSLYECTIVCIILTSHTFSVTNNWRLFNSQ